MEYKDEEKRSFCVGHFIEYLNTLDTLEKFWTFVNGISPQKIKDKLKAAYKNEALENENKIVREEANKLKNLAMDSEIDVS